MFVYRFELVNLRALWSAVETCYGLSCLLIAMEHKCESLMLHLLRDTVRPSVGTSVCHCGTSRLTLDGISLTFIWVNLQKCSERFHILANRTNMPDGI